MRDETSCAVRIMWKGRDGYCEGCLLALIVVMATANERESTYGVKKHGFYLIAGKDCQLFGCGGPNTVPRCPWGAIPKVL